MVVFDGGGDLGDGVGGDVDGGGVDDGEGELDFEAFGGEGEGKVDVEEVADAEVTACLAVNWGSEEYERWRGHLYRWTPDLWVVGVGTSGCLPNGL